MTRRHFNAIAAIIRETIEAAPLESLTNDEAGGRRIAACAIARDLATVCASTNPNFDRARFLSACGVEA